jgi:hypothetical protein
MDLLTDRAVAEAYAFRLDLSAPAVAERGVGRAALEIGMLT